MKQISANGKMQKEQLPNFESQLFGEKTTTAFPTYYFSLLYSVTDTVGPR